VIRWAGTAPLIVADDAGSEGIAPGAKLISLKVPAGTRRRRRRLSGDRSVPLGRQLLAGGYDGLGDPRRLTF
jgi:hypothetical protein